MVRYICIRDKTVNGFTFYTGNFYKFSFSSGGVQFTDEDGKVYKVNYADFNLFFMAV